MKRNAIQPSWWWAAALLLAAVAVWPVQPSRSLPLRAAAGTQLTAAATTSLAAVAPSRREPVYAAAVSGERRLPAVSDERHPRTPEREALQQELRLVGALQDALDLRDAPAMRALITRYRAHVPGDENQLAEGYTRIADCLEALDREAQERAREAAQAYYESERASTLRRYIRRVCLERR